MYVIFYGGSRLHWRFTDYVPRARYINTALFDIIKVIKLLQNWATLGQYSWEGKYKLWVINCLGMWCGRCSKTINQDGKMLFASCGIFSLKRSFHNHVYPDHTPRTVTWQTSNSKRSCPHYPALNAEQMFFHHAGVFSETLSRRLVRNWPRLKFFLRFRKVVVLPSDNGEMCHLKRVVLLTSSFQRAGHAVTHVEIGRRHIGRQIELSTQQNGDDSSIQLETHLV